MPRKSESLPPKQKSRMQEGLREANIVRNYIEILRERPHPGRRRTKDSIERRLSAIDVALEESGTLDPIRLLEFTQEKLDLEAELETLPETREERLAAAEEEFVSIAYSFTERKHLTYAAWRAVGVPAAVLKKAGIAATR